MTNHSPELGLPLTSSFISSLPGGPRLPQAHEEAEVPFKRLAGRAGVINADRCGPLARDT